MKKVLIISPYFPPFNTADMQRIRQSLPYFQEYEWEPTIITVDENYVQSYSTDRLLLKTIPDKLKIHKVKAFSASLARRIGIGSLSLRAFFHIRKKGDQLLRKEHFDLVYFSTTAFHVMALGPRWKKKFGVPFILDIQDPWYNTFYYQQAIHKRTTKAWIYHQLDKYLERRTIPLANGIISVSEGYRRLYVDRYPKLLAENFCIIPFGCAEIDFTIAEKEIKTSSIRLHPAKINVVYIGRGGNDMAFALSIIFDAIKEGLQKQPELFKNVHLWFIGTSYAQAGLGRKSIEPLAHQKEIARYVTEIPDRIPYFETLHLLSKADILLVPGSTDPAYTASKIYPYLYLNKPLLSVFHKNSSVCEIVKKVSNGKLVSFGDDVGEATIQKLSNECYEYLSDVISKKFNTVSINSQVFEEYTAKSMTKKQVAFFNKVIQHPHVTG